MQQLKQITLANIGDSSLQEIFDWVAFNLLKQGRQSLGANQNKIKGCAYRSDDGLKCGIGFCMTDEEYSEDMEGEAVGAILGSRDIPIDDFIDDFTEKLQDIHDFRPLREWKQELSTLAKDYKLNDKIVDLI